ncbi:unnamed protein product [Medioppia subpectinata]|uniref:Uncharacterized protein n=1 Tax=Medioppia subpectinata TaxID=1979941 RepID=A0A7R9PYW7_9ACAR|nr:unnamed protein product [Medioppia subpectinata]CAG2106360.1 unnamed protein product [Medioppia subpectinata]
MNCVNCLFIILCMCGLTVRMDALGIDEFPCNDSEEFMSALDQLMATNISHLNTMFTGFEQILIRVKKSDLNHSLISETDMYYMEGDGGEAMNTMPIMFHSVFLDSDAR